MTKKKYQTGGLDENNLPIDGGTPTNSAVSSVDQSSGSLSLEQSASSLAGRRQGVVPGMASVGRAAQYSEDTGDQAAFDHAAAADGIATPNAFPEMELAESRVNDLLMAGLLSSSDQENIVEKIRKGDFITPKEGDNMMDEMLKQITEGYKDMLSPEDYEEAVKKSVEAGLLDKETIEKGYLTSGDTYADLLHSKEKYESKIEEKERLIKEGGWGFSTTLGVPGYGGGDVAEDWLLRSEIERNNPNSTVMSSVPVASKLFGLTDKWMGEEYWEHKSSKDFAGTLSTAEGQLVSIAGPIITLIHGYKEV